MGVYAVQLKPGEEIIYKTHDSIIQTKVKGLEQDAQGNVFLTLASGDNTIFKATDTVSRGVANIVPGIMKRLAAPGKTPYEVLAFHTQFEYETTNDEKDLKKKIIAKFRDYDAALAFAQNMAFVPYYERILLRT
jgi:hypothetical protein